MTDKLIERFFKYIRIDTASNEKVNNTPSTPGQIVLAGILKDELSALGLKEIELTGEGYLYARLPANHSTQAAPIGFIAHLDTSDAVKSTGIKPVRFRYAGGDVVDERSGIVVVRECEELRKYIGREIITTDGTTLLGADDKAGIAIIMTAIDFLIKNTISVKHPEIFIAFVPDEEIGHQVQFFDKKKFRTNTAFTVDGGGEGEIEYANFNAVKAVVTAAGRNVHPGYASGHLINSIEMLGNFIARLSALRISPNDDFDDSGFIHPTSLESVEENGSLSLILRDFTVTGIAAKKKIIEDIIIKINEELKAKHPKFDPGMKVSYTDQYANMEDTILKDKQILDNLKNAVIKTGTVPILKKIRGGTDGAALARFGVRCPNIFTGGHNFHGKSEWIAVDGMERSVMTLVNLASIYAGENV